MPGLTQHRLTDITGNNVMGTLIFYIFFGVCFMNALFTLASAAIWIPHILYWRVSEERQLEKKYENYQEYKKKTWF